MYNFEHMFLAIVPAYNEEKTIATVIKKILPHVDAVVVVDDASTDSTVHKAQSAGAIVVQHALNRGQGAALETGHEYARLNQADWVVHFDADDQFHAEDILPALECLKNSQAHILFGSRFLGKESNIPWTKHYILFPLGKSINRMFGSLPLSDVHNGFRILSKEALEKIRLTHDRMAHATEISVLAKKHGLAWVEFPVKVTYHRYGQGGIGAIRVVKDLFTGIFIR